MEFEQLAAFLAVAQTKNFTKASEILHISQSTVSTRIKMLEQRLNKELFIRDQRNVQLSTAGTQLLPYAIRINELVKEGSRSVHTDGLFDKHIVFGSIHSIWDYVLFPFISSFRVKEPKISLRLITGHSSDIVQKMMDGLLDIGVVVVPPSHHEIEVIPFYEDPIYLVGNPSYKNLSVVVPEDFNHLPYVHINWGMAFESWFSSFIGEAKSPLRVDHTSIFIKFLLQGDGIGFLPESIAKIHFQDGSLIEIPFTSEKPIPTQPAYIIYPKRKKEYIKPVLESLPKIDYHH